MDTAAIIIPDIPGTAFGGGFYAGRIYTCGKQYAIIVAPKAFGEFADVEWHSEYKMVDAARSFNDGAANTAAMAEAGSDLAKKIIALDIDGNKDWYLPSRDELELCYRNLKPTAEQNSCWRGDNPSSIPPGWAYMEDSPAQTTAEAFKDGGAEAFSDEWYWSSTQYAGSHYGAWFQTFVNGHQHSYGKDFQGRARAVRRLIIQ